MTLAFASLVVAILLIEIALLVLNPILDKQLALNFLTDGVLLFKLLLITAVTGLLSGAYPALVLSKFRATDVFKGNVYFGGGPASFRSIMVVLQFSMAIVLSIATTFVYLQLDYVRNIKLGFDDTNIVVLENVGWTEIHPQFETLRSELLKNDNVKSVSASISVPGREFDRVSDFYIAGSDTAKKVSLSRLSIDHDFFKTYDVKMLAGRDFSRDQAMDIIQPVSDGSRPVFNVVINEAATRHFGFASAHDAIDRILVSSDKTWDFDGRVVGVVSDFHILAGHGAINPYVYSIRPDYVRYASIKISGNQLRSTLNHIDETWNRIIPKYPIVRSFLRDDLQETFVRWERTGWILVSLSALSILIAVLGCFAMAAYSTKSRSKEVGLRKVLGASSFNIVSLLTLEFSKPVLIANFVAWPIAYLAVRTWLDGYSYRVEMSGYVFVLNGLLSLIISALVVGVLTLSVARMNPAGALRHE
jgi:putative ABC transport system permease protein